MLDDAGSTPAERTTARDGPDAGPYLGSFTRRVACRAPAPWRNWTALLAGAERVAGSNPAGGSDGRSSAGMGTVTLDHGFAGSIPARSAVHNSPS
jgi:hypothetical protein